MVFVVMLFMLKKKKKKMIYFTFSLQFFGILHSIKLKDGYENLGRICGKHVWSTVKHYHSIHPGEQENHEKCN
jgi:hypothetical protein